MAAPSVGSDQNGEALGDTPTGNITRGINKCNELTNASSHAADLQTQNSSMVFGDIDRNGNGVVGYGQDAISLAYVNRVTDNAEIMKDIYGSVALGNSVSIVDEDGDLSNSVTISGSADCNTAGSYSLTYNVIDSEDESDSAAGGFDEEAIKDKLHQPTLKPSYSQLIF